MWISAAVSTPVAPPPMTTKVSLDCGTSPLVRETSSKRSITRLRMRSASSTPLIWRLCSSTPGMPKKLGRPPTEITSWSYGNSIPPSASTAFRSGSTFLTSARLKLAPARMRARLKGWATFRASMSLLTIPGTIGQKVKKLFLASTRTPTSSRFLVSSQRSLAAVYPPKPPPRISTFFSNSSYGGFSQGAYRGEGFKALLRAPNPTINPPTASPPLTSPFMPTSRGPSRPGAIPLLRYPQRILPEGAPRLNNPPLVDRYPDGPVSRAVELRQEHALPAPQVQLPASN